MNFEQVDDKESLVVGAETEKKEENCDNIEQADNVNRG